MLSLFRDLGRFSYNHGLTVAVFILPYVVVIIAARMMASAWSAEQPVWNWLYISLMLAVYPFYVGRLIKYLAWLAAPPGEAVKQLSINAQEWRRLFLVNVIASILVTCGLLVLVLPGIYLAARFAFAEFIALLRADGPVKSLEKSWRETAPQVWTLFLGALVIFSGFTLVEMALEPADGVDSARGFALAFGAALLSILQTLTLVVFFFRVYCLPKENATL